MYVDMLDRFRTWRRAAQALGDCALRRCWPVFSNNHWMPAARRCAGPGTGHANQRNCDQRNRRDRRPPSHEALRRRSRPRPGCRKVPHPCRGWERVGRAQRTDLPLTRFTRYAVQSPRKWPHAVYRAFPSFLQVSRKLPAPAQGACLDSRNRRSWRLWVQKSLKPAVRHPGQVTWRPRSPGRTTGRTPPHPARFAP